MLDTVQVKHYFRNPLSEGDLRDLGAKELSRRRNRTFVLNPAPNEPFPRITFIFTPDLIMHVSAECSIPKLLFGHNSRLPRQGQVNAALKFIGNFVEGRTGLNFEPGTATVSIVHYSKDLRLGEAQVYEVIRKLAQRKLMRFDSMLYNRSTLYFYPRGKAIVIRIYPKMAEVLSKKGSTLDAIEAARGKLRVEYCFLKSRRIGALVESLQLPDKAAKTLLKAEISDYLISKLLTDLAFEECLTETRSNLEILESVYPRVKAYRLNSFIQAIKLYGEKFYRDPKHNLSKYTYDRDVRDCLRSKVWIDDKSLE